MIITNLLLLVNPSSAKNFKLSAQR